ncbi:MurR/RpiR family transcriptional regulator [Oscillibacter hominis]|uniref:MurR/RpiR family transcriptional regulator n=1 Tax=Oscillibacter hominis TaxID=2763056 RepID=A0A7G9B1M8_9FIRM|nr:MurR/RpiR family transcriptional regulator [Oscillibacter hominis]QNL43459.1 MurR/RpiR family transcriptional regulator [Oscillibacter hominis]
MAQSKIEELLQHKDRLPRQQQAICEYVSQHISELDSLTASQLAKAVGVGDATIFRFLKNIGYESYGAFRADVKRYAIQFSQSSYWKTLASLDSQKELGESSLMQVFSAAIDVMDKSMTATLIQGLNEAASLILSAPKVGFFGLRTSKPAALYFYYLLLPFLSTVQQLGYDEHFIFERVRQLPTGSVIFFITSWPNTKMTIDVAEFCHQCGHRIILLTNEATCPIAAYADLLLQMPEMEGQYSIAPYILMADALAKEIGLRLRPESLRQLHEADAILAEWGVTNWSDR